jgi:hypothetical protein
VTWVDTLRAERARHVDWHVCYSGEGLGKTDYAVDAADIGLLPCPIYLGLSEALAANESLPDTEKGSSS